jgi:hypothetical protein
MEGSSLSDKNVIDLLNSRFIPLYANLDVSGFPDCIPAVESYRKKWKRSYILRTGIATSAVVDPSGRRLLGESGSSFAAFGMWKIATNYNADKFLAYLEMALATR